MLCPNCRNQIYNGEVFCPYCGYNLGEGSAPQQPQSYNEQFFNTPQQSQPAANTGGSNTNRVLVGIISAMTVLLLSSAFVLFVKPGYMLKKDSGSSGAETIGTLPATQTAAETSSPPAGGEEIVLHDDGNKPILSSIGKPGGEETTPAETTTKKPKETTTTTTTTKAPATTTAAPTTTTQKPDDGLDKKDKAYSEAMGYSTYERPTQEDFLWCIGQNGFIVSPPEEYAEMITEPLGYSGSWKSMIIYNPTNSAGTFMREYDNVEIGIYDNSVSLTIDWYMYEEDFSERYSLEDMDDSLFVGELDKDGSFTVTGICSISLYYFWKQDGKEYALGQLIPDDGIPAYFALVRP